ncbi:hypothetical protein KGY73_04915 [bacterium]|nr:hypothetical protein [bacterium]
MARAAISLLAVFSFFLTSTSQNIEKAFLQNNPRMLYSQFSSEKPINISFPQPLYFSDQISDQQAYFFFKNIFSTYSTFEFYSERKITFSGKRGYILKARWSFKNKKNNNQYVFHLFFYLSQSSNSSNNLWKITEIRAVKI